jgi:hypothetical protein
MSERAETIGRPRAELLRQRTLRQGWFLVAAGLLIPVLALGGAANGYKLRRQEGSGHLPLIVTGAAVFVGRLALWLSGF